METKTAIKLINHVSWNAFGNYGYDNNREEMIALLKRGEKYKQIVKNIESDFENSHCNIMSENSFNIIEEKYFPPKVLKHKQYINILFTDGDSICIKMIVEKYPDGRIIISNEAEGHLLEKGGET